MIKMKKPILSISFLHALLFVLLFSALLKAKEFGGRIDLASAVVDSFKANLPVKKTGGKGRKHKSKDGQKPRIEDTIKVNVYADNWFVLYVNGEMVAVDSIKFIPHNVISVNLLPKYPMTIAVMAKDNADPQTAMEYKNSNIGDGGFILKFSDGTVTDSSWKAKNFFHGPIGGNIKKPQVSRKEIPNDWYTVGFDDSAWSNAKEFTEEQVGPKQTFYDTDFKVCGDYEFLLRVLHVFKLRATMVDVFVVRFHLGGASSENLISLFKSNYECYKAWKMNDLSLPFYSLPLKVARKIWQHIILKFELK